MAIIGRNVIGIDNELGKISFDAPCYLAPGSIVQMSPDYNQKLVFNLEILSVGRIGGYAQLESFGLRMHRVTAQKQLSILPTMEQKQIKDMLIGQGLNKQEVEIILAAIKGVKIAPLAYSELNAMTEEVIELKEFRDRTQTALGVLGVGITPAKKERKPRSDKGTSKAVDKGGKEVADQEAKEQANGPAEEPVKAPVKKTPTPRGQGKAGGKKETAEEIKANVDSLGDGPKDDIDL